MSTELYIEEYADMQEDVSGAQMQSPGQLVAKQKVAIGAASAASAAFNARTEYIILTADVKCQWELGATADASSRYLPANVPRSFNVENQTTLEVIEQQ